MTVSVKFTRTASLEKHLRAIAAKLGSNASVSVGFVDGATYPTSIEGGTITVAQVAYWNEFGTLTAPARPFFRSMIDSKSPRWGHQLGVILRASGYNGIGSLALMGELMKGQLVQKILRWPADNAPYTVRKKGFNKGLVETALMSRSVDYQVLTERDL